MISKYLYGLSSFVLAFAILSISVLRSSAVAPAYGASPVPSSLPTPSPRPQIEYPLPYHGEVLPDNWLWYFKAGRDRVQYVATSNKLKKAELALLYSDKRLGLGLTLLKNKKPDLAVSTLTKGEKYLEIAVRNEKLAREEGINTDEFLVKLATSALKHREIIEAEILPMTPEDLKPEVVKAEDYSKNTYKSSRDALNGRGKESPKDPFNGQ
jgi:hypothetical protein